MAHTKQTPRNPNVDNPTTAMGSDVQPERRTPFKTDIQEITHERRETALKTPVTQINKVRQITYRRN